MRRKGIIIVVSGFSGAGKGTLMKKLTEVYPNITMLSLRIMRRESSPMKNSMAVPNVFLTLYMLVKDCNRIKRVVIHRKIVSPLRKKRKKKELYF